MRVRLCLLLLLPLLIGCATEQPAQEQPNIVFIMADDLGYGDLGAYGQEQIQTPHLDRMAAEGVRFTQFYAGSTVCAPSRSVLMTGQHTGRTPVRGNAGGQPELQTLAPEDVTVAEVLKDAGYATALIGKWGLGEEGSTGHPNEQGFDYFFGYLNQRHAHNYYPEFLWRNSERVSLDNVVERTPNPRGGFPGGYATERNTYSHDLFMEEALAYIEDHQQEPFFLYLALTIPHANNEARHSDEYHGMEVPDYGIYADRDWPEPQKGTAAMITLMDEGVGDIMERLRQLGLDDETIVFFTSDNGPHAEGANDPSFFDSNGPLRGIKRDLYEGGIRVPMIAWWPGEAAAGETSDYIGYFADLMPTAASAAGAELPDGEVIDGLNFLPAIRGQSEAQPEHEYLYWEFYEGGSAQAVRMGPWKGIRAPMFTGPIELYNLEEDLGEEHDISAQHPGIVDSIEAVMEEARVSAPEWEARLED